MTLSASHVQQFTVAVAGVGMCACDIEWVEHRPEQGWHDALGPEGMKLAHHIAGQIAGSDEIARTRVWTAIECLRKAGIDDRLLSQSNCIVKNGCVVFTMQLGDLHLDVTSECIRLLPSGREIAVALLVSTNAPGSLKPESITTGMRMNNENV